MTHNSQIPQQLGQYLYQQINGDWSKAMLVLDCQHDEVITCQAFYEKEADETQHPIAVSDHIIDLFKTLFDSAIQNQPENWQRAIFNITRQGKLSIALDKENNDEN
ncbi:DUF600 domain-containing protein [Pseudoalteromonas sp. APAL1]|uniref:DUF600 domain-containing protein n=1 Tax=Pseudoalteromonas TaxID=53246 RepID=UPI000ED2BD66|nr:MULTISPECIES: DUF600 domain-containing protein [unclassified Pseudoalteromonas]MCF2921317.1 DUF600 domain-containing protein [Pseudoalteromonas sp. APAL1]HCV01534.1 DUF600 domain-containing protein [Pseudoalteromonas sp.]|tara:strand:+ start:1708 stop:2025 length:318 start_codon:yes stop_codon:yes gene_type:complete